MIRIIDAKRARVQLNEAVMNIVSAAQANDALDTISPRREMGSYEALWLRKGASFKSIADQFASDPTALPSDFVSPSEAEHSAQKVVEYLKSKGVSRFGVRINHAGDYPSRLRDARNPVELLYYRGMWELSEKKGIAIVGSRKPSEQGLARAKRTAKEAVEHGFTVVSGLASGIDTAAHTAALESGARTIAVIGTTIGDNYPKENAELQEKIADEHLLISQVPILRYNQQDFRQNRLFFPERNATMSALTQATVIIEAAETSGTLTQARAALYQRRKLFILDSCFKRTDITWPARFEGQGAIRVRTSDDLWSNLSP